MSTMCAVVDAMAVVRVGAGAAADARAGVDDLLSWGQVCGESSLP